MVAGLEITGHDLQRFMGEHKKPWEIGKRPDHAAPIGAIHRVAQVGHFKSGTMRLTVNGQVRQNADRKAMICSVPEQITERSSALALCPRRHPLQRHARWRRPGRACSRDARRDPGAAPISVKVV